MSTTYWLRGKATIHGQRIVLDPDKSEVYEVDSATRRASVEEFYVLSAYPLRSPIGKKKLLRFISNFGLLRQGLRQRREITDSKQRLSEQISDWEVELEGFAKTMKLALLHQFITFGTASRKREAVQSLRDIYNEWGEQLGASDEQVIWCTGQVVCSYVNGHLLQTQLSVKMQNPTIPMFKYEVICPDLLGLISVGISEIVTTSQSIKLPCLHCGKIFEVRDRRMKYCSAKCRSRATSQRNYNKKTEG